MSPGWSSLSPALESKGNQRHSLLACPPFIFLTIFLESNEQYEYIKAVLQPGGTLQVCPAGGGGGRWMFFMWKLREKLCSRKTCPTVEALSWLSVPSPSSVSPCVCWSGERAVTECFVLRFFPSDGCHGAKINNYHSVMVTAPLCLTHYGERFYINHLSDILWDGWFYLPVIPCTVSVVCVWSGGRGAAVLEHIFCF